MALNPKYWTEKTAEAVSKAKELAEEHSHVQLAPIHLAVVLFAEEDGLARSIANKAGASPEKVEAALRKVLSRQATQSPAPPEVGAGQAFVRMMREATEIQKKQNDSHLAVDHVLLALHTDSDVAGALNESGLDKKKLEMAVREVRGGRRVDSKNAEETYEALMKYGHDLVTSAEQGKLDPVIGTSSHPTLLTTDLYIFTFRFSHLMFSSCATRQVATTRSGESFACCPDVRRTTRCSSASRAWVRPPSWRASPSVSCEATYRPTSRTAA